MAMQALPYITAGYGALEGAKEGGPLGALTGGGLGFFGGKLGVAPLRALTKGGIAAAPGVASALGIKGSPLMAKAVAAGAIPIAGGMLAAPLIGGLSGKAIPATAKAASGALPTAASAVGTGRMLQGVFNTATGEFTPLETDPASGMPRGPRTASEMLNPQGYEMGALELQRRAQDVGLEGAGKFMNLERSYLDEAKTRDLARSAAAARLATDLATQQGLTLGGQRIAGAMGTQALSDVGAGLRTQYRYL
jgi:hypothetical protein